MRTHRAARRRVAHHDVVHAPARHEGEELTKPLDLLEHAVDALHEEGPVWVGGAEAERLEVSRAKRAAPALPRRRAAALTDEPRQGARLARERAQTARRERAVARQLIGREQATDEQRTLLPVLRQELGRPPLQAVPLLNHRPS